MSCLFGKYLSFTNGKRCFKKIYQHKGLNRITESTGFKLFNINDSQDFRAIKWLTWVQY